MRPCIANGGQRGVLAYPQRSRHFRRCMYCIAFHVYNGRAVMHRAKACEGWPGGLTSPMGLRGYCLPVLSTVSTSVSMSTSTSSSLSSSSHNRTSVSHGYSSPLLMRHTGIRIQCSGGFLCINRVLLGHQQHSQHSSVHVDFNFHLWSLGL